MRRVHRWDLLVSVLCTALCAALVTSVGAAQPVAAQSADDGLEEASVNSFEFDPVRGVVRVTIDIDLRNVTTDRVEGDVVRRTYFDGYAVAVPLGAENIVASDDGTVLDGTLVSDPDFPAFSTYRFPLGTPLFSGESTSLRVTYDHLGAPPRDPVPWRVNEAYAGFVAFGLGDEGRVTLRISQPFAYEFDEFTDLTGFDAGEPDGFGTVVYTRAGLSDDTRITVGLANDDRLVNRPLVVEGVDVELRSWPDDPEWADFAAATVEIGIPALEELIGTAWPLEGSVDVRETVEPSRSGYAGWFDTKSNEIAVGEALDADTIYHELSHAWFNSTLSTERWLTEGLAQVYAAELTRRDGDEAREPTNPAADATGALPLTDWGSEVGELDRETEEYGYGTSFWVVDALVDEIGFDRTSEVVAALRSGASPYATGSPGEQPDEDWQRVYDTLVEAGGSATANELFRSWVVDAEGAGLVVVRDQAAADVTGLEQRGTPWPLPTGVRNRLERWEFDDVDEALTAADDVLDRRAELESIEAAVGIDEPDLAGPAYGDAPMGADRAVDFTEANQILDGQIAAGALLTDRLRRITELSGPAEVTPPAVAALDGVDDFDTALEAADDQLLAIEQIIEVEDRLDSTSGPLVRIGAWGSGIADDIDDARAEVEAGDNAAALDTLDTADERIEDLALMGAIRLVLASAVVALVLAALMLLRRRRRSRDDERPQPTPATL